MGMQKGLSETAVLRGVRRATFTLMLGVSLSACASLIGNTMSWKEEIKLHDGQIVVVERLFHLGGYPTLDSHNRSLLDETITFTLPESNKKITWKTEYRNEVPEPNSLGPLLLDVLDGVPYIATSPAGKASESKSPERCLSVSGRTAPGCSKHSPISTIRCSKRC